MKRIIYIAASVFFFLSCTENFEEVNTNPNLIDQISPGTLLNEIIYNMANNNVRNYYDITAELMQVKLPYPSFYGGRHRYEILDNTGNSQWNASYKWAKNIREMLAVSEANPNDANYKAIGLTLRAWIYSNLTDSFGDIPFSEASKGDEGGLKPKYDTQQEIYMTLLQDLEEANTLYNHENPMLYGKEILFDNNTKNWQRFTNSLHLRLLLRISNVYPEAFGAMVTMLNQEDKYPIITDFTQSAALKVTGITPNLSPWSRALDFSTNQATAAFFVDHLNELKDPRLPVYATEAKDLEGKSIGYVGIPSAYVGDNSQFKFSPSYMNNKQVVAPMSIPILMHSEVEFIKAELAQRGYYNSSSAAQYYMNGVKSAIFFVTGKEVPASYFEQEKAKYNGSLAQIMLQKYVSLYFTDYQQWAEYRRTGLPVLPTTSSMLNEGKMPYRLLYHSDQKVYNPTNYTEASQRIGGDKINSKIWWIK